MKWVPASSPLSLRVHKRGTPKTHYAERRNTWHARRSSLVSFPEGPEPSRNDAVELPVCVTIVDAHRDVSVSGASICREKDTHYPSTCIPCISRAQSANAEIWYRLINNRKTQTPGLCTAPRYLISSRYALSLSHSLFSLLLLLLPPLPSSVAGLFFSLSLLSPSALPPPLRPAPTPRSQRITARTNGMKRDALKTCRNNKFLSRVF